MALTKQINTGRARIRRLNAKKGELEQMEFDDMEGVQSEITHVKARIEAAKDEVIAAQEEADEHSKKVAQHERELAPLTQAVQEARDRRDASALQDGNDEHERLVGARLLKAKDELRAARSTVQKLETKLEQARRTTAASERECERVAKSAAEVAGDYPRPDRLRRPAALAKEKKKCEKRIEASKKRFGKDVDVAAIKAEFEAMEDEYNRSRRVVERVREVERTMLDGVRLREKRLNKFKKAISRTTKKKFSDTLQDKGHMGELDFDHTTGKMNFSIAVDAAQRNTAPDEENDAQMAGSAGELSGGERSYTLTSLFAALATVTESPFRMVDEIDIYMDATSRKLAMDTLIMSAIKHGHQLIVMTPQDVSMYARDDYDYKKEVKVHALRPPREGEARL